MRKRYDGLKSHGKQEYTALLGMMRITKKERRMRKMMNM
jgi:hypothetical protein